VIENIANKMLTELQQQINLVQGLGFSWTQATVDKLVVLGFSETMGARPMKRVINDKLKKPVARHVLFNKGKKTKEIVVDVVENNIELKFE
jgi:ATP-dependent Clp protease ATP-binding subunit ClpA